MWQQQHSDMSTVAMLEVTTHTQQTLQIINSLGQYQTTWQILGQLKSLFVNTAGAITVHMYSNSQNHFEPILTHMLISPLSNRHMSLGLELNSQFVSSMAMYMAASAKIRWNRSGR